jgi:rhodanese-related sulfurtransferase
MQEISRQQLQRLVFRANARLIEVLPASSFRQAHLPGAVNVPLDDEFDRRVQHVLPDKNVPVIVYCADRECSLSPCAAEHLDRLGYTKVFDYKAGKADWQQAGLQVERGGAPPA